MLIRKGRQKIRLVQKHIPNQIRMLTQLKITTEPIEIGHEGAESEDN